MRISITFSCITYVFSTCDIQVPWSLSFGCFYCWILLFSEKEKRLRAFGGALSYQWLEVCG